MVDGARVKEGDVVLGLASSGLHSNGYSLVRRIVEKSGLKYEDEAPFAKGEKLGQALLTPTRLYVKSILKALELSEQDGHPAIRAMANITGGGLPENAHRMLPEGLGLTIDAAAWELPPVFRWLAQEGNVAPDDLAVSLNCGVGMIVICDESEADRLADSLRKTGETVYRIGRVRSWDGRGARVEMVNWG
jgi:phosphoribosylformylglycinamidine cyclo-ligase